MKQWDSLFNPTQLLNFLKGIFFRFLKVYFKKNILQIFLLTNFLQL